MDDSRATSEVRQNTINVSIERTSQTYRVGEEILAPLECYFPVARFPKMRLVHTEHPKKHFVVTAVNEAEGSITLASGLVNEREDL